MQGLVQAAALCLPGVLFAVGIPQLGHTLLVKGHMDVSCTHVCQSCMLSSLPACMHEASYEEAPSSLPPIMHCSASAADATAVGWKGHQGAPSLPCMVHDALQHCNAVEHW